MSSVLLRATGACTVCLLLAMAAPTASAQPPAGGTRNPPPSGDVSWSIRAGVETFSLRDVSRVGPPVDASPVAWVGRGPSLVIRFDRERPSRLIRAELLLASIGHFSYDTGVATSARPAGDHAFRLEGRYQYRWFPLRDVLMKGLDVGGGLQGIGAYVSLSRQMPPAIEFGQREERLGAGAIAAVRFHRWQPLTLEAAMVNGGMVARTALHHSAAAVASTSSWGGGWLTDFSVDATVRVATRTSLVVTYFTSGEGHLGTHRGYAAGRGELMAGVTYAR